MPSQGFLYPNTVVNDPLTQYVDHIWYNPNNIKVYGDGNDATYNMYYSFYTNRITGNNYGFSIPSDATVRGVEVKIRRKSNYPDLLSDYQINVVAHYDPVYPYDQHNRAEGGVWPTVYEDKIFGADNDLWDYSSITPAEVNSSIFAITLRATSWMHEVGMTFFLDSIGVKVHYTNARRTRSIGGSVSYNAVSHY